MKVLSSLPMTITFVFTYFSWSFFSAGYFSYGKYDTDHTDMGIVKTADSVFSGI